VIQRVGYANSIWPANFMGSPTGTAFSVPNTLEYENVNNQNRKRRLTLLTAIEPGLAVDVRAFAGRLRRPDVRLRLPTWLACQQRHSVAQPPVWSFESRAVSQTSI
jgi:hypothetical protein